MIHHASPPGYKRYNRIREPARTVERVSVPQRTLVVPAPVESPAPEPTPPAPAPAAVVDAEDGTLRFQVGENAWLVVNTGNKKPTEPVAPPPPEPPVIINSSGPPPIERVAMAQQPRYDPFSLLRDSSLLTAQKQAPQKVKATATIAVATNNNNSNCNSASTEFQDVSVFADAFCYPDECPYA